MWHLPLAQDYKRGVHYLSEKLDRTPHPTGFACLYCRYSDATCLISIGIS
jgi:hypothetical protein